MSLEVRLLDYKDLSPEKQKEYKYHNYYTFLQVKHKGNEIAFHSDMMEREDARFYRDLSWIDELLEEVYNLGIADGKEKA